MPALHVMHVIDGLGLGGAERMAVDLANEAVRTGYRVTVCVTRSETRLADDLLDNVQRLVLGRRSRYNVGPLVRLLRYTAQERVDVVHAHMRSSMALALSLRAARLLRAPTILHDHYGAIEVDTSVPRWFQLGRRWIDQYVGVSPKLGEWALANGVPEDRVHVFENALDLARLERPTSVDLRGELGLKAGIELVLLVATLRADKGIEVALEGLARAQHGQRAHLAVAGALADSAYATSLYARARELGLAERVSFLGGRQDVPGLLGACDFAVSSSHTESGPLVLIEFVCARRPFVATEVGDIGRRLAAAGVSGFVPPRDPAAFARALDELLVLSPTERAERADRARSLIRTFDLREVFPRWAALYERTRGAP